MNNSRPRILIIYPYPNIDTNPTMTFLLQSLAERKVGVDVLLKEGEGFLSPEPFGETIHLEFLPSAFFFNTHWASLRRLPRRIALKLFCPGLYSDYSVRFDLALFGMLKARRYSAIVGVDPLGITLADSINRWAKRPLVYISFEIMFADEVASGAQETLKRMEQAACGRTSLVLIQDPERTEVFCRETSFPRAKIVMVPLAPPPQAVIKTDYLRKTLGIPKDRRIVLHCGTIAAWASRDELAEMVSYWKDDYCLVIHNRSKINGAMARYLKRLTETKKIYVSTQPVTRKDMTTLVASADFGLAPYKPVPDSWYDGDNLYHLGFASGKVSYYAMCGLPILARSLPVFDREFSKYKCGRVYRRMSETDEMLQEMDRNYAQYSEEARRFYRERLNPVQGMDRFCNQLVALAGIRQERTVPETALVSNP